MKLKTDVKNVTAFRMELLNDPNLPRGGPGRSIYGTAALSEFAVEAQIGGKTEKLKFAKATADYNPPAAPLIRPTTTRAARSAHRPSVVRH